MRSRRRVMSKLSEEDKKEILTIMARRRRNRGLYTSSKSEEKKELFKPASDWEELGVMAFARFYDLTMKEAIAMISDPNKALHSMIAEMRQSLTRYEDFMVRVRRAEEKGEEWTRLDFLDFRK